MNKTNMFESYPDVVTVEQLQRMLGVGRNTAYKLINNKEISSMRIGKDIRIPKIYVIEYLEKSINYDIISNINSRLSSQQGGC